MVAPYEVGDPIRSYVRVPGSGTDKAAKALCCDLSRVSPVAASAPIPQSHLRDDQPSAETNEQPEADKDESNGVNAVARDGKENLEKKNAAENHLVTVAPSPEVLNDVQTQEEKLVCNHRKRHREATEDGIKIAGPKRVKVALNESHESQDGNDGNTSSVSTNTAGCPSQLSSVVMNHEAPRDALKIAGPIRQRVTPNESRGRQDGSDRNTSSVGTNPAGCGCRLSSVEPQTNEHMNELVMERNFLREKNILLERRLAVFRDLFRNKERLTKLLRALEVAS